MDCSSPLCGHSPGKDAGVGCHFILKNEGYRIHNNTLSTDRLLSLMGSRCPAPAENAPPENTCRRKRNGSQGPQLYHPPLRDEIKVAGDKRNTWICREGSGHFFWLCSPLPGLHGREVTSVVELSFGSCKRGDWGGRWHRWELEGAAHLSE